MKWRRVNKKNRCPICHKEDWCGISEDGNAVICMRVESGYQTKNGGWLHRLNGATFEPRPVMKSVPVIETTVDVQSLWLKWFEATTYQELRALGCELGVSADSLCALGCAWNGKSWAFPMKDAEGKLIGIRLRAEDGRKFAVKGSKSGLFIPGIDKQKTLFITEGVSDAAAAIDLGMYAIGRAACLGQEEMIVNFIRLQKISRAAIITDNDGPGWRGAVKLRNMLPVFSCVWIPPCKDLREFKNLGGDYSLIESSIKDLVWERAA